MSLNQVTGTWEDVQEGHYVQDKNGKWWKVVGFEACDVASSDALVHLVDGQEQVAQIPLPPALHPVTFMYDPIKLVEQKLDGKEVS